MGSINDSRVHDDSALDIYQPAPGQKPRGSRKTERDTVQSHEKNPELPKPPRIDEQSALERDFNTRLVLNSAIVFGILLLSSSDFRFEHEM